MNPIVIDNDTSAVREHHDMTATSEADDEFWDATTSWDMHVEVPAKLISLPIDDNVKFC